MLTDHQREDFFAYLRFPSISADPSAAPAMLACAEWLRGKFTSLGFSSELHATPGPPVLVARRAAAQPGAPTLLIYGHYDVQPVDPLALWRDPPFEPVLRDGLVYARGATDNKGQTFTHILGTEAWLRTHGELPVNLIYLMEGEEEIGSPHLGDFLRAHAAELSCDSILVSDTSMIAPGRPALTCGLRGIACLDLRLTGPVMDLHSGVYGGAVVNPATELARLLAAMHDSSGRVAIPGFYDEVASPDPLETAEWRTLPYTDEDILRGTGAPALGGEAGFTSLERLWIRPTAEVNRITAGYQGPGSKTIIPREATAKLSFRLVPNQEPEVIAARVAAFFEAEAGPGVKVEVNYDHGGAPYFADPTTPSARAVRAALAEVFGCEAVLVREGLSIPIVALFKKILGRDTLLVGLGLPDCAAHSPNETFPLAHLELGIALHQALLRRLGATTSGC